MKGRPSNVITLPRALRGLGTRYVTRSGEQWQPHAVALCFALALRNHGTVDAVRATARRLSDKVCAEQRPKLRTLSRPPTNLAAHLRDGVKLNGIREEEVILVATRIIDRVCDLMQIAPETPFELNLPDPPRCHFKPMRLAGEPGARRWACQHCNHTKRIDQERQA